MPFPTAPRCIKVLDIWQKAEVRRIMQRLELRHLSHLPALDDCTLAFPAGQVHAIIAEDATSILRVIAGQAPYGGTILWDEHPLHHIADPGSTVLLTGTTVPYPTHWQVQRVLAVAKTRYPRWNPQTCDRLLRTFSIPRHQAMRMLRPVQRAYVALTLAASAGCQIICLDFSDLACARRESSALWRFIEDFSAQTSATILLGVWRGVLPSLDVFDSCKVFWQGKLLAEGHVDEKARGVLRLAGTKKRIQALLAHVDVQELFLEDAPALEPIVAGDGLNGIRVAAREHDVTVRDLMVDEVGSLVLGRLAARGVRGASIQTRN